MAPRVIASELARRAAQELGKIVEGDLSQSLIKLREVGQILSNPQHWDSQFAREFRSRQWPEVNRAINAHTQELMKLHTSAQKVIQDILSAGNDGSLQLAPSALAQPVAPDVQVKDALDYFHKHLNDGGLSGDRDTLNTMDGKLRGLTPEQREQFLRSLSDDDLKRWNKKIGDQTDFLWYHDGLSQDGRIGLANMLFGSVSREEQARLEKFMPVLQPNPNTQYLDHLDWKDASSIPVFNPSTGMPDATRDINQGDDGDCWFLSGLGAVTLADPNLIKNNIHANSNGTYTVTFYKDGHPVPVTVTDRMPYSSKPGFDYPYAHDDPNHTAQWAMIYEKAYAQFRGGYGNIDGGWGNTSLADLTGKPSTRSDPGSQSVSEISSKLHNGYALTAGSNTPWHWPWQKPDEMVDNGKLVAGHEYMVESADPQKHTVTLLNPWGPQGSAPHRVTLSEGEFRKYFGEVSYAKVK